MMLPFPYNEIIATNNGFFVGFTDKGELNDNAVLGSASTDSFGSWSQSELITPEPSTFVTMFLAAALLAGVAALQAIWDIRQRWPAAVHDTLDSLILAPFPRGPRITG